MLLATVTRGGNWWPSRCNVLYTSPMYERSCLPSVAPAQDCISSRILDLTSALTATGPTACRSETRLSMNSREAISAKKCDPPFLTHVSVSCIGQVRAIGCVGSASWGHRTFKALSCVLGFLLPMRRLRDRMASLGATVLDLMTSEISRFRAMSSLVRVSHRERGNGGAGFVQAAARGLFDLLVQSRVGRGRPPAHHLHGCELGSRGSEAARGKRGCAIDDGDGPASAATGDADVDGWGMEGPLADAGASAEAEAEAGAVPGDVLLSRRQTQVEARWRAMR